MQIAKATTEDIPALLGLVEAYWRFERLEGFDAARLQPLLSGLLAEPRLGAALIATMDNRAVGYLVLSYSLSLEFMGLVAEVDEFFITPEARSHGLGQRLLAAAERECRLAGCAKLSLQVSQHNDGARRFYRRHGFESRSGYQLLDKTITDLP